MKIKVEVTNQKDFLNIGAAETAAMDGALIEVEKRIHDHFESYQSVWDPLKEATIAERIRLGFGPTPILVRNGTLRDEGAVQGMNVYSPESGEVFTEDEIAIIQDKTRSFYQMTPDDYDRIVEAYYQALKKAWGA